MISDMQIGQTLQTVFGQTAERVALETRFVQRTSKMSGLTGDQNAQTQGGGHLDG